MTEKSFGSVASNLLSSEAKGLLCFGDPENVSGVTYEKDHGSSDKALSFGNGRSEEPMISLPCLTEDKFGLMVGEEKHHLPKDDYFLRLRNGEIAMSVREPAMDWILKAHAHYGFGELAFYLAMNYFDRFLSLFELPEGKSWTAQLLAVACLSLGAKMAEINIPLVVELQVGEPRFVFSATTIKRMELLVLSTLKWKMHSYTPYSFIDYFLTKISGKDDQQNPNEDLMEKAVKLILKTIKGIDFLEFKPSEIAAAVAIFVAGENIQELDIGKEMSCFILVEKDRVLRCHKLLKDLTLMRMSVSTIANVGTSASVALMPHSPNGVLEVACLSYKSDARTAVASFPNSSNNNKRKKLDTTTSPLGNSQKSKSHGM